MPVPAAITDLSTTAGSNSPAEGASEARTLVNNYLRAHAAFIAALRDGSKNLELGSASAPSLSFTGDTNTGIYSPGANRLGLTTDGTLRWEVDASGRLINPANSQVSFRAYRTSDQTTGAPIVFDTEAFDRGGGYDTATGAFTAPVTGIYLVSVGVHFSNTSGSAVNQGFTIFRNGTTDEVATVIHSLANNEGRTLVWAGPVLITASEYINVRPTTSLAADNKVFHVADNVGLNTFSAHLLG